MSSKAKIVQPPPSDDEADQVEEVKPVKTRVKKERTPAQKEAFTKALEVLKQKREAVKTAEKEKFEKASAEEKERIEKEKYEKAKQHKKKLPPAPSYVTTGDLEKFKMDILNAIPKNEPKPVKVEPVEPVKVKVEPAPVVVQKPVVQKVVQKPLTGHELLDKLFFS